VSEEIFDADGGFRKRHWTPGEAVAGAVDMLRDAPAVAGALRADRVDAALREKMMLAVTAVNDCRHCARIHTSLADRAGVDDATIDRILASEIDGVVADDERPALLFARAYADADGEPAQEEVAALREAYGPAMAGDVRAYVRAIHRANMAGNTLDAWLDRAGVDVPR
jgi:AhpD family alkylhydroperoxidase